MHAVRCWMGGSSADNREEAYRTVSLALKVGRKNNQDPYSQPRVYRLGIGTSIPPTDIITRRWYRKLSKCAALPSLRDLVAEIDYSSQDSKIPRAELIIQTKLNVNSHHRVREAFEDSLKKLDCEYIDVYLMHWPMARGPNGMSTSQLTRSTAESDR